MAVCALLQRHDDALRWKGVRVDGRRATYGVGGEGPPVLFLHGWALGNRAYRGALAQLVRGGCRVLAPGLPGLAGNRDLPVGKRTFAGYAAWVEAFCEAVGLHEPALVIGHSFGGGVATLFAHDHPDRVHYLVLLNAIGGARWRGPDGAGLAERPLWDWALHFGREVLPSRNSVGLFHAAARDVLGSVVRNPIGLWRAAELARSADLTPELRTLAQRELPILALTSEEDSVIPRAAFESLCASIGTEGRTIAGRHSWLLSDPASLDEVLGNVLALQQARHTADDARDRGSLLASLLGATSMPVGVVAPMIGGASPLWLMSAPAEVLAGDLALAHPAVTDGEVRAVVRPVEDTEELRLTVVARDRPGLLADTAAILASEGLGIIGASAATWQDLGLALHSMVVHPDEHADPDLWDRIGERLRAAGEEPVPAPLIRPPTVLEIDAHDDGLAESDGDRRLIAVRTDDQLGLLARLCRSLSDQGIQIESLRAITDGARVDDHLIVKGTLDVEVLDTALRDVAVPFLSPA